MKIVTDCNVVIAAGLTNGSCRKALVTILENHTNYISDEIVREYRDVILREKFKTYKSQLVEIMEIICTYSIWQQGSFSNNTDYQLPDPDDQIYLDLALTIQADYLVTGNNKDFPEKKYNGVKVISPRQFLELHKGEGC